VSVSAESGVIRVESLRDPGGEISVGAMSHVTARYFGYYYYYGPPHGSPGTFARG